MSKHIQFSGPFLKQFYCKVLATNERSADNPVVVADPTNDYADTVPSPLRRVYLFIQNNGTVNVTLSLTPEGVAPATQSSMILYPGQSVSFDNYNGPILASTLNNVHIMEAFA